jgi:putative transposase
MSIRQPHRKQIKHFHVAGHFHELTSSCYRRRPLLTNDAWLEQLARCIDTASVEAGFVLNAFVFMPEHVHLLVLPRDSESDISRLLARIKQPFSKAIKQILIEHRSPLLSSLTVRERPGKKCFRFWQEGPGFDRNLFTAKAVEASIDYIHINPVRRGLCKRAADWKWSSARFYIGQQVDSNLPRLSRPPAELFSQGGVQIAHQP